MKYRAINSALYSQPLLLLPQKADEIRRFIELRSDGVESDRKDFPPQPQSCVVTENGLTAPIDAVGSSGTGKFVAVLPLFGTLFQHGGVEMNASGGTSTEQFGEQFSKLLSNPAIKSIVIEVHSPGGQVWGTQELSDIIFAKRNGPKRVITVINSQMASGALWVGTAAHEVIITPGGEAGSIGVVTMHQDISKAEERDGIKTTLIAYPQKKVAGHEFAPLDDEARREIEAKIKGTYQRFVSAVARNRGVSTDTVESRFGGGGMLRAEQAVAAGLADSIGTKQQVLFREMRMLGTAGEQRRSVKNQMAVARLRQF